MVEFTFLGMILPVTTVEALHLRHKDIRTAILNGDLEESLLVEQPDRFAAKGKEPLACRLKKAIYGHQQAPRQ